MSSKTVSGIPGKTTSNKSHMLLSSLKTVKTKSSCCMMLWSSTIVKLNMKVYQHNAKHFFWFMSIDYYFTNDSYHQNVDYSSIKWLTIPWNSHPVWWWCQNLKSPRSRFSEVEKASWVLTCVHLFSLLWTVNVTSKCSCCEYQQQWTITRTCELKPFLPKTLGWFITETGNKVKTSSIKSDKKLFSEKFHK